MTLSLLTLKEPQSFPNLQFHSFTFLSETANQRLSHLTQECVLLLPYLPHWTCYFFSSPVVCLPPVVATVSAIFHHGQGEKKPLKQGASYSFSPPGTDCPARCPGDHVHFFTSLGSKNHPGVRQKCLWPNCHYKGHRTVALLELSVRNRDFRESVL